MSDRQKQSVHLCRSIANVARGIAGVMLIVAIVFAPLACGGRPMGAVHSTEILLALSTSLGLLSQILSGRWRRIPRLCASCIVLLLIIGWYSALFPRSVYVPEHHAFLQVQPAGVFAGSVDQAVSVDWMERVSVLLGAFLVALDLMADIYWQTAIFWTISMTAFAVASVGIVERFGIVDLYGRFQPLHEGTRFSAFSYHANAGAFFNLAIPAAFAIGVSGVSLNRSMLKNLLLDVVRIVPIAGAFVNVSRASQVITLGILTVLGLTLCRSRSTVHSWPKTALRRNTMITALLLLCAIVAGAGGAAFHRWKSVDQQLRLDSSRVILDKICIGMSERAGLLGYGPGTFKILLPVAPDISTLYSKFIVTWYTPGTQISMWCNAHNDYLQTVIEWGWLGASIWTIFVAAGLFPGAQVAFGNLKTPACVGITPLEVALIAVVATLIHSIVDFPLEVLPLQLYFLIYTAVIWLRSVRT